ncbi:MAG: hypothetical protein JSW27_12745 [Phycisphaerales bacterium]|nr:MAG: hypothetical protein JSW27_12745 [Phycisphaerales bacterium]
MTKAENQGKPTQQHGRWRRLAFHLAAAAVALSPLAAGELVLRLCVAAPPARPDDPYVSFSDLPPLFVLDPNGSRFETAATRLTAFRPQTFPANKNTRTFRIFCLGGSTVQGRPYSVETSFTTWLQLNLKAAQPETNWEVINCGGISYATYRLVPIMRELLAHQPDLFVIYAGHNEFLEDRTYADIREVPHVLIRLHRAMLSLRSYALADRWLARRQRRRRRATPTVMSAEVQTKLDLAEGLESYQRDPVWRRNVIAHFRHDLAAMTRMAQDTGIPVILVNPVVNLKDCPPFKSEFRTDLSEHDRQQLRDLWDRARALEWTDIHDKIDLFEQAVALDSRHARLLFLIGTCYEHIGQWAEAKQWFVRAKDEDICPLRILEPMRDVIRDVAIQHGLPLVDIQAMIEARTDDGIPGDQWLLDHVHPTISGHQFIADALCRAMAELNLVRLPEHWESARRQSWQSHLASLNDAYYAQGLARLKRVRDWSRGRIHQK